MDRSAEDFQDTYPLGADSRLDTLAEPEPPDLPAVDAPRTRAVPSSLQFLRDLFTYRFG